MSTSLNRHTLGEDQQRNHLANGQRASPPSSTATDMVDDLLQDNSVFSNQKTIEYLARRGVQANRATNLNDEVVKTIKSFGDTTWQTPVAQLFHRMTCALSPARMRRPKRVDYTSHDDETDDLRWLTEASLIFDRVSDELFNIGARIWTVPVSSK